VILLDTNILSALMRSVPDPDVLAWMDRQDATSLWTTSVTVFEIRHGLERLPAGRRQAMLSAAFEAVLREELDGRVAGLDRMAAEAAGRLAAQRQQAGRPVDVRDTLIAGIALAHRATIATRNTRHFDDLPTGVVDPRSAT
jgi:toxin FitB